MYVQQWCHMFSSNKLQYNYDTGIWNKWTVAFFDITWEVGMAGVEWSRWLQHDCSKCLQSTILFYNCHVTYQCSSFNPSICWASLTIEFSFQPKDFKIGDMKLQLLQGVCKPAKTTYYILAIFFMNTHMVIHHCSLAKTKWHTSC